jgi:hypothetical protein
MTSYWSHLGQLLLSAQSSLVLVLQLVQFGRQLVLSLDSLGVSLDSSGVLLFDEFAGRTDQ